MAWFGYRIERAIEWSQLTKLGKSRMIQTSYVWLIVVPAMAKAIAPLEMLGQNQTFEVFGVSLTLHVGLPFSWKVFYVSALLLALSSLLYQLFCPRMIKDLDGNSSAVVGIDFSSARRYAVLMGLSPDDVAEYRLGAAPVGGQTVWDKGEKSSPIARTLCGFGYLIGLTLIAWVIGQGVVSVVPLFF